MIYVLEDDNNILELILYALNAQNLTARGFSHPNDFFSALQKEHPQIIVLDIMLPQMSGFEILSRLKSNAQTKNIAILLLSALGAEMDKVRGLELGADDYITKPFGVMEFIARIKNIMRRISAQCDKLEFDGAVMDLRAHTLSIKGKNINLTLKEFELLKLFLSNIERVFSRNDILQIVWEYDFANNSRTLDIHINTLRGKLGAWGKHIKTIRGVGYKLARDL